MGCFKELSTLFSGCSPFWSDKTYFGADMDPQQVMIPFSQSCSARTLIIVVKTWSGEVLDSGKQLIVYRTKISNAYVDNNPCIDPNTLLS
mmetsp:Transcript_28772/g.28461  ORF Transcript_28772/g.28461 Transcript_28772/m.28461 type:complete len:90 (-) Transcript_28772:185-454(-)